MRPVPPFKWALRALADIRSNSDAIVVSQTPEEALVKEWELHDIRRYVDLIAGQELGTKAEQLKAATADKYAAGDILMVGDAIGDLAAARETGALFYPVMPGQEDASWERFVLESYPKFLSGVYAGDYQAALVSAFVSVLPVKPVWEN